MITRRLVVGNWKMNPSTLVDAKKLIRMVRRATVGLMQTDVVACPPYIYIPGVISKKDTTVALGAQNVSFDESGPHTGEISVSMLKDIGVQYVIVGHSEVRAAGDTDAQVARRTQTVLAAGLKAIVCVGEKVRDEGGAY